MAPFRSATGNARLPKGIAYPTDLTALKQVFDQIRREHGIPAEGQDAEDLAQATMSLFNAGVVDEAQLRESLIEYLGRKVGRTSASAASQVNRKQQASERPGKHRS